MLPYVIDKIDAATSNRVQIGLKVAKATRNILRRMAKAAPLGAIERNAVTGVGDP
jgi:hypothetical protein